MKLDSREQLIIHIEGLQATLRKRNARIAELEAKLSIPIELPEEVQKQVDKAFIKGWKACAIQLQNVSHEAKQALMRLANTSSATYWMEKEKKRSE